MKAKRILAIFIVMLVVAVTVPLVASADTTQDWFLDDAASTAGRVMDKGAPDATATSVSVANGGNVVWIADEQAQCAVPFPGGNWSGHIWFTAAPSAGTDTIALDVGSSDNSAVGNFTSNGVSQTLSPDGSTTSFAISIDANAFTVSNGDYLAFRVSNTTGAAISVDTGGSFQSFLSSPTTDPGYPIPELPTIVLLATGLVGLAAYFGLKRRKRAYVRA